MNRSPIPRNWLLVLWAGRFLRTFTFLFIVLILIAGCSDKKNITDEQRPLIHKVYFQGIKYIKESKLREKILVENEAWIRFSPSDNYLDHPFAIDLDKERIEGFYRDHGYFHAKVLSAEARPYKGKRVVDVHFVIEEGSPTKISVLHFIGFEKLSEEERTKLTSLLKIKVGDVLNREAYLEQKEQWELWLKKQGYAFAEVGLEVRVNRELRIAEVDLTPNLGKKVRFGEVTVEGCEQTDPKAVAFHAALPRGAFYHPEEVEVAKNKLYALGIFSSIKTQLVPHPSKKDVVNVKMTVIEGKSKEAQVGLGLGIEPLLTSVQLKGGYTQRNFLGGLRTLKLTGQLGYAATPAFWSDKIQGHGPIAGVEVQFTQPDLLGRNSEFRFNFGYNIGLEPAYQYHGPGFNVSIQRSLWRRRILLGLSYHFQFLKIFKFIDAANEILQNDPEKAGLLFGYQDPYLLGYFRQSFILDLRDREVEASRGLYVSFVAEEGGPYSGSAFQFQKILPEARAYMPLGSRVTIAARMMFGQMFSNENTGSPITQRFYLGGPNSHRGFNYNRLSAQYIATDQARVPIGGDQMFFFQAEVRVNVARIFGNWLSMVGFVDGGDVTAPRYVTCGTIQCGGNSVDLGNNVDLGNLHWAVGGGLRYRTIIGTLRFDLGVRLNRLEPVGNNPDPNSRFSYHISIGEAF